MMKEKLRNASEYVTFPAMVSVVSVEGINLVQKAMEAFNVQIAYVNLSSHAQYPAVAGAMLGTAIGNCYMNDHSAKNFWYAGIAFGAGLVVGSGVEHMSDGPLITAFTAAAAGLTLRRHLKVYEDEDKADQRRYDDLDY